MGKDDRLYAKFTLDFPTHPKIRGLSDAAFRCLVEATIYSRQYLTDGFLAECLAQRQWNASDLLELTQNDPQKPSLLKVEAGYIIRDYAEHQQTKADIEALRERNRIAGQAGGLARSKQRAKRNAKQGAKRNASETLSETLSRDESTEREDPNGSSPVSPTPHNATPTAERAYLADLERQGCPLCDDDGYRLPNRGTVCDHIDRSQIAANGSAAVRKAMAEAKTRKGDQGEVPW